MVCIYNVYQKVNNKLEQPNKGKKSHKKEQKNERQSCNPQHTTRSIIYPGQTLHYRVQTTCKR